MTCMPLSMGVLLLNTLGFMPAQPWGLMAAQANGDKTDAAASPSEEDAKRLDAAKATRVHFALDEDVVPESYRDGLQTVAAFLKEQANLKTTITGHADERGTSEYNMALGERRAKGVMKYLTSLGVEEARMRTLSYGEERPVKSEQDEAAWSENRRVEFEFLGSLLGREPATAEAAEQASKPEEEQKKPAEAAKKTPGNGKDNSEGGWAKTRARRFAWLPIWVGPVIMLLSVPILTLAAPFLASMLYLGWEPLLQGQFSQCREPVDAKGFKATAGASPSTWCGSLWSVIFHSDQRTLAGPILGVGILGTVVAAGTAVLTFAAGTLLLVMALLPGDEAADAASAGPTPSP
jgi:peptidoglycan-associated lipoprotein